MKIGVFIRADSLSYGVSEISNSFFCYPVAANNELKDITNDKIDLANTWVEQLAEEYGLKYLDTNSALKGDDGYLPMHHQNGDGLHLMPSGFDIVLNYIRTHGYPDN